MSDQAISRNNENQPDQNGSEKKQEDASAQAIGKENEGSSENLSWWSMSDEKRGEVAREWLSIVLDVLALDDVQRLDVGAGVAARKEDGRALPYSDKKVKPEDKDWVFSIAGDSLEMAELSKVRFPTERFFYTTLQTRTCLEEDSCKASPRRKSHCASGQHSWPVSSLRLSMPRVRVCIRSKDRSISLQRMW